MSIYASSRYRYGGLFYAKGRKTLAFRLGLSSADLEGVAGCQYHYIKRGDTLRKISKRYYGTEEYEYMLAEVNNILDIEMISDWAESRDGETKRLIIPPLNFMSINRSVRKLL